MVKSIIKILVVLPVFVILLVGCGKNPTLDFVEKDFNVKVGESFALTPLVDNLKEDYLIEYSLDKNGVVEYKSDNTFKAIGEGVVNIKAIIKNYPDSEKTIIVAVTKGEVETYTVKFIGLNDEVLKTEIVVKGESATAPTNLSVDGYEFKGWDKAFDNIISDLKVKAIYEKIIIETYIITFRGFNDVVLKTEEVSNGSIVVAPTVPTIEGYEFVGWDKPFDNVTSDLEIQAIYKKVDVESYVVTFMGFNNAIIKREVVEKGSAIKAPDAPYVYGYIFKGWDKPFDNITSDLEIQAIYEKVTYDLATEIELKNEFSVFKLKVGETIKLEWRVLPITASSEVKLSSENTLVAVVKEDGTVTAVGKGNTHIVLKTLDGSNVELKVEIYVEETVINKYTVTFIGYNNVVLKTETVNKGESTIAPTAPVVEGYIFKGWDKPFDNVTSDLTIKAVYEKQQTTVDTEAPTFGLSSGTTKNITLNWNTTFDPLQGVTAIDNVDGDLTSKIKVTHNVDNRTYGTYNVKYEVVDKAGNVAEMTRTVEVVWNYSVEFIGHGGCYYGAMNSEEAILYAVQVLKYTCVEVDLKMTKDGVFVLCHDETFGGYTIASTNWSTLKNVEITSSRTSGLPFQNGEAPGNGKYTAKLCTLDKFLEICKQYGTKAVIELKGATGITNSDQSNMPALMTAIKNKDMLNSVILLGSAYNCLIWTRNNGYGYIPCQYLVNTIESETYLNRCIEYNLDISTNTTYGGSNSDEWIARYKEAGIKISTYTYTQYVDYSTVQQWIDKGVDYVTCDWHSMDKLTLPLKEDNTNAKTYTVTFKDYNGTILKTTTVQEGKTAFGPSVATRTGYEFTGWDKEITNVTSDLVVTATYKLVNYSISYVNTLNSVTISEWASKEDFASEIYNDYYAWLLTKVGIISGLTKNGNTLTLTKNGSTAVFSSGADILAVDKYVFEVTLSNYIYKPVTRASDGTCVIEASEDYFLNSDEYRIKYQEVDAMLYRCIKSSYTTYDTTYTPTSAGKIQIFFRLHQWLKGEATINGFLPLAKKYTVTESSVSVIMPTTPNTYTIESEIILPTPTSTIEFLGWYTNSDFTGSPITKIEKGSTGNITLYAKWKQE